MAARKTRRGEKARKGPFSFELAEEEKDSLAACTSGDPANLEVYDPGDRQRVPEAGAWAMITRQVPPLEGGVHRELRVGRIFYIQRSGTNVDAEGFSPNGTYKALCRSPWGDVWLWPYEYSIIPVNDVVALWSAEELVFHPLQIDGARFSEIAFYARSRGIGLADAAAMALGTLSGSVGWFEPRADLAEECEALERRVHHPWPVKVGGRRGIQVSLLGAEK